MSKAALVDQVKGVQRQSPEAKQAWWDYCDTNLGGVKDPNRHDESTLSEFIQMYQSSGGSVAAATPRRQAPAGAAGGWGGAGGGAWGGYAAGAGGWGGCAGWAQQQAGAGYAQGGGSVSLSDFVKAGQRSSPSWKEAWQKYCQIYGSGYNDPAKYDDAYILQFVNYIGDLASSSLEEQATEAGVDLEAGGGKGTKRHSAGGDAQWYPPAKKAAITPQSWAATNGAEGGDEKGELVTKIKALQRANPEAKQMWWKYCDETLGGVKDPNRHDATVLQEFIDTYAL